MSEDVFYRVYKTVGVKNIVYRVYKRRARPASLDAVSALFTARFVAAVARYRGRRDHAPTRVDGARVRAPCSAGVGASGRQHPQHAAGVADLILWRYHHEGWTSRDLECALYQTTLLAPTMASSIARPRNYLLNTPWSDWTPPSQSEARFDSAHANRSARRPDRIAQRVSVHVCATPDPAGHGIVAFATVESCNASRHLILRRGVDILLNIPVDRLDVSLQSGPSDESGVLLLAHRSTCSTRPSEPHPRVFIKFVKDAGNQRLIKFLCMICVGLPPLV